MKKPLIYKMIIVILIILMIFCILDMNHYRNKFDEFESICDNCETFHLTNVPHCDDTDGLCWDYKSIEHQSYLELEDVNLILMR